MAADGFIPSTALILAKPSRPITTLLTSFFAEDFFRVDINKSYHEPRRFAKTTAPDGQITSPNQKRVKPLRVKYLSSVLQKYVIISPHPASTRRGVSRSSRTLGAGCGGREDVSARLRVDEGIFSDGQAAWSCPPDAGDKPARRFSPGDGGQQARSPEESTEQPLTPSRRECRLFRPCLW